MFCPHDLLVDIREEFLYISVYLKLEVLLLSSSEDLWLDLLFC